MYAIELTKGDDTKVMFKAETLDAAMQEGDRLRTITPRENGLLTLVKADYDESDNKVNGVFKLIHGWK